MRPHLVLNYVAIALSLTIALRAQEQRLNVTQQGLSAQATSNSPWLLVKIGQAGFQGNEADAVAYVAGSFHIPTLAEIALVKGQQITIPAGVLTAQDAFQLITLQSGDTWVDLGSSVHIYRPEIFESHENPLSIKLDSFSVEKKPSEFKYYLATRLNLAEYMADHPNAVYGFAASGIVATELDENGAHCDPGVFSNIDTRELLLRQIAPARLAVIMVIPKEKGLSARQVWESAQQNWFWLSVDHPPRLLALQPSASTTPAPR